MLVRLRRVARIGPDTFRLTLDLYDPDRPDWAMGDCAVRVDVQDSPKHGATARGPLAPALELYRLSPEQRPEAADARLLWDMGQAVNGYVARVVAAAVLCPWRGSPRPGRRSVRH